MVFENNLECERIRTAGQQECEKIRVECERISKQECEKIRAQSRERIIKLKLDHEIAIKMIEAIEADNNRKIANISVIEEEGV